MDAIIDTELLISAVEAKRIIWDVSNEEYKNRDARQKAWEDIAADLITNLENLPDKEKKTTVLKLQKRWKTVRDAFTRHRSKGKDLKSGEAAKKRSKYVYYENLKFLERTMDLNSTETNFTENDLSQSESPNIEPADDEHSQSDIENIEEESQVERVKSNTRTFERKKAKKLNIVEESLVRFLNRSEETQIDENKSFLDSLLPTLRSFNENQKLHFRIEVLNLMLKIKNDGSLNSTTPVGNVHGYRATPGNNFHSSNIFHLIEQQASSSGSSATTSTPLPMYSPTGSYDSVSTQSSNTFIIHPQTSEHFTGENMY